MKMMKRKIVLLTAASTFMIAGILLFFSSQNRAEAQSKNFYFPEVKIEIHVARDGSFSVDEYRTYDFRGSFSWATLWIPLHLNRGSHIISIELEEFKILDEKGMPLRMETSRRSDGFEAKWYYRASNQRRTFHIHYRVQGGVYSYPDCSELYWQVIGSGWDRPTGRATATVHLPEPVSSKDDLLVYGHGPLSGMSEIVNLKTARFTASDIAAHQFMEIRMIWPAGLVNGVLSSRYTRESIRREEAGFVEQTIARAKQAQEERRRWEQEQLRRHQNFLRLFFFWIGWLVVAPLIWLPFYVHSWKKVGKDYQFDDIPDYYRELPSDLSPAMVEILLREGRDITPLSFTATLFDLARRGFIELDDRLVEKRTLFGRKEDYKTTVICKKDFRKDQDLLPYEAELLELVFVTVAGQSPRKGTQFQLDELEDYLKKNPQKFQKWYRNWIKQIKAESKKLQFIELASLKRRNLFLAATIPITILSLNPVLLVISGILIPKIKRRARHWARENELWRALDRFLDDFARFRDLPPEAYKLWEHYLVFGIIFGNAKKILKMLPVILKDERAVAPVWYYGFERASFISSGRLASMISSIDSMATSIQQASTSAAHYSSGGGGGFSSGGGGGGGGGGGSAG